MSEVVKAADFDYALILPFLQDHRPAWEVMRDRLGRQTAFELAKLERDEVIYRLRVLHDWTLVDIGEAFGVSRERVRQIVDVGGLSGDKQWTAQPLPLEKIDRVLRMACYSEEAWVGKGALSKDWLIQELQCSKHVLELSLNVRTVRKFTVLVKYGLGLVTDSDIREQMTEWQGKKSLSYQDISKLLSEMFVPISTMAVYRGAEAHGYKGDTTGAPGRARSYYSKFNVDESA